jgi:rare lipoprotein A
LRHVRLAAAGPEQVSGRLKRSVSICLKLALIAAAALAPLEAQAQCGRASSYALTSKTASGERMNPKALTAAHRSLPFGTKLRVTNQRNGRSVVVRVNDRGPFIKGRVLDLSKGAAQVLGFVGAGHTKVCMLRAG